MLKASKLNSEMKTTSANLFQGEKKIVLTRDVINGTTVFTLSVNGTDATTKALEYATATTTGHLGLLTPKWRKPTVDISD